MEEGDPRREAARLISTQLWFALGTVDESGVPSVSYVPFACTGAAFGIVVSRLSAHTGSLLARRPASVLLVDDQRELDAYARARFSIAVTPSPNAPGSPRAEAVWAALEARQGATTRTLHALPDFEAISLEPQAGRLVLGFASAYNLRAAEIEELLRATVS